MDFAQIQGRIETDALNRGLPNPHNVPCDVRKTRPCKSFESKPVRERVERVGASTSKWSDREKVEWFDQTLEERQNSLRAYLESIIPHDDAAHVFDYIMKLSRKHLIVKYTPCIGIHFITNMEKHLLEAKCQSSKKK